MNNPIFKKAMDDDTMSTLSKLGISLYNCCSKLASVGLSKHSDVVDWNAVDESDFERVGHSSEIKWQ